MDPAIIQLQTDFIDALEFLDPVIQDRSSKSPRLYIDKIKRGAYQLGSGIVKNKYRFYSNMDDQSGLTSWRNIQVSTPAEGEDPGINGCTYDPKLVTQGTQKLEWTGFETSRRTEDVCLKDIKYKWQFQQQLKLYFGFLSEITLQVWEQFARENYLKMCSDESQLYVLAEGAPNGTPVSAVYDPFTSSEMTVPITTVGKLEWSFLAWWQMYYGLQVPEASMGTKNGIPTFAVVLHPFDVDEMIRSDASIREDFRYYESAVLIDGVGSVQHYRGWAIIPDMTAPRFSVKTVGASTMVLKREAPFITEAITTGNRMVVNPAYLNAQYALGVIFLDKVFQILVPPSGPSSAGGGTAFGSQPNLMGDFRWLNIPNREDNLLEEIGFYFARYEAFTEPLDYSNEASAFLYKRCPQTEIVLCAPCDGGTSTDKTITAASRVVLDGETASLYTQVEITLSACLDCEAPAAIGIDYGGGSTPDVTGIIVSDANAPTYIVGFATAANYVDAATIVANTSQINCS